MGGNVTLRGESIKHKNKQSRPSLETGARKEMHDLSTVSPGGWHSTVKAYVSYDRVTVSP